MTGEEMERAIEFLLSSQASLDARVEQTNRQIAETNKWLEAYAGTQAELLQAMRQNSEEQKQINAEQRQINAQLLRANDTQSRIVEAQNRINAEQGRINVESIKDRELAWAAISALAASQAHTDERLQLTDDNLNRLAETVRRQIEGRNGNSGG